MRKIYCLILLLFATVFNIYAQEETTDKSKFRQFQGELPTPNTYRAASGAPGHQYWQQRVDYDIDVELNDDKQSVKGSERITYYNNSPDQLTYLWLQLDQNISQKGADKYSTQTGKMPEQAGYNQLQNVMGYPDFDGGYKIEYVKDATGKALPFTIVKTMMRIDLPQPLKAGEKYTFQVAWNYNINDRMLIGERCGYEFFPEDGNYLYTMAQWFPRLAVYNDVYGWQHKQFLGRGEFTLCFGNYKVRMTVPSDHIVAATGVLQNPQDVLTAEQRNRFEQSKTASKPVMIVTQAEATEKEKTKSKSTKTWVYHAENVRDFAWGSSRKYIWDAMGVKVAGKTVMAMSYYPKEANPLYETYSTEVVAHTIRTYSKYTIDYPYPVAISVEASNGMEYPMICFNYGRPEKDGTYSERIKYGMISVIIHEVGHNFFPMIINSDERQWTWMDEGLNSFVQVLTEQEWERNYPSQRLAAYQIVDYMKGDAAGLEPIMTNSESIKNFGSNAYGKPAVALNILRETILGRELFDFAFKEYARRWAFKQPYPADLFRTMEDASGVDLDWFWRGWFFSIDKVDISLETVKEYALDTKNPEKEKEKLRAEYNKNPYIGKERNKTQIPQTMTEQKKELNDFYNNLDKFAVTPTDKKDYEDYLVRLNGKEKEFAENPKYFYELQLKNLGGLVMPVIVQLTFEDGKNEVRYLPAEIWRMNEKEAFKVLASDKKVSSFLIDPYWETADIDIENNYYPRRLVPSRFEIFKQGTFPKRPENPMQRANREKGK